MSQVIEGMPQHHAAATVARLVEAEAADQPLLLSVENVFSIEGRGTVATGRIERGVIKVGEEVEIVGIEDTRKTVVTGVDYVIRALQLRSAGRAATREPG